MSWARWTWNVDSGISHPRTFFLGEAFFIYRKPGFDHQIHQNTGGLHTTCLLKAFLGIFCPYWASSWCANPWKFAGRAFCVHAFLAGSAIKVRPGNPWDFPLDFPSTSILRCFFSTKNGTFPFPQCDYQRVHCLKQLLTAGWWFSCRFHGQERNIEPAISHPWLFQVWQNQWKEHQVIDTNEWDLRCSHRNYVRELWMKNDGKVTTNDLDVARTIAWHGETGKRLISWNRQRAMGLQSNCIINHEAADSTNRNRSRHTCRNNLK